MEKDMTLEERVERLEKHVFSRVILANTGLDLSMPEGWIPKVQAVDDEPPSITPLYQTSPYQRERQKKNEGTLVELDKAVKAYKAGEVDKERFIQIVVAAVERHRRAVRDIHLEEEKAKDGLDWDELKEKHMKKFGKFEF